MVTKKKTATKTADKATPRVLEAKEAASKATNADKVVKTGDARPDNNKRLAELEARDAARGRIGGAIHADRRAGDTGVGPDAKTDG